MSKNLADYYIIFHNGSDSYTAYSRFLIKPTRTRTQPHPALWRVRLRAGLRDSYSELR